MKELCLNKILFVATILLLVMVDIIGAQTIEQEYYSLLFLKNVELNKIDSLQNILNLQVEQINSEKKKEKQNENRIKNLMAHSAKISIDILVAQKKLEEINKNLSLHREKLEKEYTQKIDSLRNLQSDGKFKGSTDEFNTLILHYSAKRLMVTPELKGLTFQPEKILLINPESLKDTLERKIYLGYFTSALNEAENGLKVVNGKISEVKQIVELERRTRRFLSETDFDGGIRQNRTGSTEVLSSRLGLLGDGKEVTAFQQQIQNYNLIINQLSVLNHSYLKAPGNFIIEPGINNTKDYLNLLEKLKKLLLEYSNFLKQKIGSNQW